MKIALYCRVSKRLGQVVANQIPILENWAKAQGYEYKILTEEESTRKTRPVREGIIQKLRLKEFDGVACVRLDRWLRSFTDVITIKELVERGCSFFFVSQGLFFYKENNTAMTNLQLNMLSAFAEFERELIRERTFDGLERAKQQGKILGRPKGSKDKASRRKSGYWERWANTTKKQRKWMTK